MSADADHQIDIHSNVDGKDHDFRGHQLIEELAQLEKNQAGGDDEDPPAPTP